jgi:hypothetical protein
MKGSSAYRDRDKPKIVIIEDENEFNTSSTDITQTKSLAPRNTARNLHTFDFPRHGYEVICKIVGSLIVFREKPFNIQILANKSGLELSVILANIGFLRSVNIISGTSDKIPPDSILMATAIRLGNAEEVTICWRRLIERSNLLKSLLEWIGENRRVWYPRLLIHFLSVANRDANKINLRGARYATDIILNSGLIVKSGNSFELSRHSIDTATSTIINPATTDKKCESGVVNLHFHFNSSEIPAEMKEILKAITQRIT